MTASFDREVVVPGESFALTVTFTNTGPDDALFTYLTLNPTFGSWFPDGPKYEVTGCTGDANECLGTDYQGGALHFAAPVPAGATRTVVVNHRIAADSICGDDKSLTFYLYFYREFAASQVEGVFYSNSLRVECPG